MDWPSLNLDKDVLAAVKPKAGETAKDVGLRLSNAVTWDLIGLSRWARAGGMGEEGEEWITTMSREVYGFTVVGKKYGVVVEAAGG